MLWREAALASLLAFWHSRLPLGCRRTASPRPALTGDRTISFYHIHTQERLTVTYKKAGRFVPEAMKQINWIMRDWRKNQAIEIDPETIDLAWEMHTELGSRDAISIICGYRSHGTNEQLRRTVGGQASQSQHITGKAIDITFPDVPLKRMRYSALIRERGGVGYYPTSGIPFVHVDTARVRSWPRLPRYELALVFPEGRSKHMPADGGPITPADVRVAQSKYRELAVQIAEFHDARRGLKAPTLVAAATSAAPLAPAQPAAPQAPRAPRYAVALSGQRRARRRRLALRAKSILKPEPRRQRAAGAPRRPDTRPASRQPNAGNDSPRRRAETGRRNRNSSNGHRGLRPRRRRPIAESSIRCSSRPPPCRNQSS